MAHMHSSHQTAKLNQVFEILYTQYLSSFHACNFVAQHYCNNVIPKVSNFRIKFPRLRPQKKQKWLWKGENLATDMICLKDIFQSNIFLKQIEKLSAVSTTDLTKTLRLHPSVSNPMYTHSSSPSSEVPVIAQEVILSSLSEWVRKYFIYPLTVE